MDKPDPIIGCLVEASWIEGSSGTRIKYYGVILKADKRNGDVVYHAIWRQDIKEACAGFNELTQKKPTWNIQTCCVGPNSTRDTTIMVINKNYGKGGDGKLRFSL